MTRNGDARKEKGGSMNTNEASATAHMTALCRAIESQKPPQTRLCEDQYAAYFAEPEFSKRTRTRLSTFLYVRILEWVLPGFYAYFAVRTRHIDEFLQTCLKQTYQQVVILGAGYDSRAYRMPQFTDQIRVFEVDHPATQQHKTTKLTELFGAVPDHVAYIPLDFHSQTFGQQLRKYGYDEALSTVFLCEGLTYYLTDEAIDNILAFVTTHSGPKSAVLFDYTSPDVVTGQSSLKEAKTWKKVAAKRGEPLRFGLRSDTLDAFLTQKGFGQFINVTSDILKQQYLTGSNQKRYLTPVFNIVSATMTSK
jgi:methyltransferase (TIGR00027 family)